MVHIDFSKGAKHVIIKNVLVWALVGIPVSVSFQALTWVAVTWLCYPSSKDNDLEYACAFCWKISTTKASLKRHLKAIQHHSYNVVGEDESEVENVGKAEDVQVIPDGPCLTPCIRVFLMGTFETTMSERISCKIIHLLLYYCRP